MKPKHTKQGSDSDPSRVESAAVNAAVKTIRPISNIRGDDPGYAIFVAKVVIKTTLRTAEKRLLESNKTKHKCTDDKKSGRQVNLIKKYQQRKEFKKRLDYLSHLAYEKASQEAQEYVEQKEEEEEGRGDIDTFKRDDDDNGQNNILGPVEIYEIIQDEISSLGIPVACRGSREISRKVEIEISSVCNSVVGRRIPTRTPNADAATEVSSLDASCSGVWKQDPAIELPMNINSILDTSPSSVSLLEEPPKGKILLKDASLCDTEKVSITDTPPLSASLPIEPPRGSITNSYADASPSLFQATRTLRRRRRSPPTHNKSFSYITNPTLQTYSKSDSYITNLPDRFGTDQDDETNIQHQPSYDSYSSGCSSESSADDDENPPSMQSTNTESLDSYSSDCNSEFSSSSKESSVSMFKPLDRRWVRM